MARGNMPRQPSRSGRQDGRQEAGCGARTVRCRRAHDKRTVRDPSKSRRASRRWSGIVSLQGAEGCRSEK